MIVLQFCWYYYRISKDYEEIHREIQLENKQSNIQSLINAIPEGIIAMNDRFEVLLSNNASLKLLNGSQALTLKINKKFNNKEENISESLMKYVQEFRDSEETTTTFGVCNASKNFLECTGSKMEWDKALAIVLTFRDVSKIINLERKVSLNSKTLRTLKGVSHDLKTPLNQIINEHQEILHCNAEVSESIKAHIKKSLSTSTYLLSLIRDMIDYSHIKFNNLGLNFSWITVEEVLNECVNMMKEINNYCIITYQADTFRGLSIHTDKCRFQQCLTSLVALSLG